MFWWSRFNATSSCLKKYWCEFRGGSRELQAQGEESDGDEDFVRIGVMQWSKVSLRNHGRIRKS